MKAIMVMYDTLNRRMLPPYGNDWIHAPNFTRLFQRAVVFDRCYAGSLPTIPTRRELHTGRYQFLHRNWGPIEPFDDSMPEILQNSGIYTHLASDGYHYCEDGGSTYHNRYGSWEFSRGQENDGWKGEAADPEPDEHCGNFNRHYAVNRKYMQREEDQCQAKTFRMGLEFMRTNAASDNWFLQIETFDPHEPYFSAQKYKDLYPHDYDGPRFDWPRYGKVTETPEQIQHCRYENAALVSMCDAYLGKVLDLMDELDMWRDTLLIVNTDHGFFLGEKGYWGKMVMPCYNEVARIPLFLWDPRSGRKNQRRSALVQSIDLAPTLMEYFGVELPPDMQGISLKDAVDSDKPVREAGLFGVHGAHVNCTDGRYVYMRAPADPKNEPLYSYTLMPTQMRGFFSGDVLRDAALAPPFSFTKGMPTLKYPAGRRYGKQALETMLFDLETDPRQERPIDDPEAERMMVEHMVRLMKANDAPVEQYERLGLDQP